MLYDELKKVQSSVALLENQRKPGVGYWRTSVDSDKNSASGSTSQSMLSDTANEPNLDGDMNLQYLRNIILQFLEHKDMRVSEQQIYKQISL